MSDSDTSSVTPSSVPGIPTGTTGPAVRRTSGSGWPAEHRMMSTPLSVGCTAPTSTVQNRGLTGRSSSPISSRSAALRSSISLRRRSRVDGITPSNAEDRIVWRTRPVVAAASTPCPHTSPTAMIHQLRSAGKAS